MTCRKKRGLGHATYVLVYLWAQWGLRVVGDDLYEYLMVSRDPWMEKNEIPRVIWGADAWK